METERFEALIDAILAIILTIIVLEIPMASNGSWEALFEVRLDFIIYALSFLVVFNFWNYNNNLFSIVNKVNHKVIWLMGFALFLMSFLPYLTIFVAENFDSFIPHALYGLDFLATALVSIAIANALKNSFKKQLSPLLNNNMYGDWLHYWLFILSSGNYNVLFNLIACTLVYFQTPN